ncbi:hypothetical protein IIU_06036 [Bacillus cereus VD133]|uniref:Uncharacterized protein n=1 Tax=Bacillus cereus VD133 TaxID=1053233 RepID=A0A9W5PL04_BACCE|nr:hypothetical protein IIU_06036 [Bacillus cereus VD133]
MLVNKAYKICIYPNKKCELRKPLVVVALYVSIFLLHRAHLIKEATGYDLVKRSR